MLRHKPASAVLLAVVLALIGGGHAQVAVLLALAVGAAAALWQASLARRQAQAAVAAQLRAEQVKQFIVSIFTEARPRQGEGGAVTAIDLLRSANQRIEVELQGNPQVAAELGLLVASSASHFGDLDITALAAEAALPRCERAFGHTHVNTLQVRLLRLTAANSQGDYALAARVGPALVADLRSLLPTHAELLVSALREHSFEQAKHDLAEPSLATLREAVAVAEQHLGPTHGETLTSIGLLSNTLTRFSRHAESLPVSELAMRRARTVFDAQRPHSDLVAPERWYARSLILCGRPAEAEPLARQCLLDQRSLDGAPTRRVADAMRVHALALAGMGQWREAVALANEAMQVLRHLISQDHEDLANFSLLLAQCWMPTRRVDEIEHWLANDEGIRARLTADTARFRTLRHRMRAQMLVWRGEHHAALEATGQILGADSAASAVECLRAHGIAAQAWLGLHRPTEALAAAQAALAAVDSPNAVPVDRAMAHIQCGCAWLDAGSHDEAQVHFAQGSQALELGQVEPGLGYAEVWLGQGRLHLARGNLPAAQDLFDRLLVVWDQANPGSVWHRQAQDGRTQASAGEDAAR